jgi:YbbR domain-containing protein
MIPFVKNVVLKDFWLKLFSLALATLAWFTISLRNSPTPLPSLSIAPLRERLMPNLPVVVLSSAEDVRSVRVNPKEVDVTVKGDPAILQKLQAKDIRVLVDLTGVQAANALRQRIEVSTPAGVTYVKVEPEEVQIIFPPKPET